MKLLRKSKEGSLSLPNAANDIWRKPPSCGDTCCSMDSNEAQRRAPSNRQRENFTASAGTNAGGAESLASTASNLKSPVRPDSGTPMLREANSPSAVRLAATVMDFNP